jgi:hypothetical protein
MFRQSRKLWAPGQPEGRPPPAQITILSAPSETWGFPSQFMNQPGGYGHTTRATPWVSLPSGSRTRNLKILDPAYKPLLGDALRVTRPVFEVPYPDFASVSSCPPFHGSLTIRNSSSCKPFHTGNDRYRGIFGSRPRPPGIGFRRTDFSASHAMIGNWASVRERNQF